eukprot:1158568-Pelagomonas_calceolata.AAC.2
MRWSVASADPTVSTYVGHLCTGIVAWWDRRREHAGQLFPATTQQHRKKSVTESDSCCLSGTHSMMMRHVTAGRVFNQAQNLSSSRRSSRNPNRNNKVALHTTLVGVAGTVYNDYTIRPLINLGLNRRKALAFKLSCHAIQRIMTIINIRNALYFQGASRELSGRMVVQSRRESGQPGAWLTSLQIPISTFSGFLLG